MTDDAGEAEHPSSGTSASNEGARERLRALELSGDPDALQIAQRYRDSPLDANRAAVRQVARSLQPIASRFFAPSFAFVTNEDADEAEAEVARVRATRERERRDREQQLHDFAAAAHRREQNMFKVQVWALIAAILSFVTSTAAVVIAIAN